MDVVEQIRDLVSRRKWNKALRLIKSLPHRSVRVLNIQGCLYACAKRYGMAAQAFAEALEKDRGSQLAVNGLIETSRYAGKQK